MKKIKTTCMVIKKSDLVTFYCNEKPEEDKYKIEFMILTNGNISNCTIKAPNLKTHNKNLKKLQKQINDKGCDFIWI